ncbi:acyl-CoA thioesterase [Fulvivirga sediminis]|uniref:Acyl-CoA thioesterase n=1 Tax=Fulvivirga sediminis TaxID=2803949 RepID=A0A937F6W5_9BACT|nr:acyl-CoA thioesterase [Fulvivirga sediminis]MBL3656840.1 acyl-CoA thioesterase [Fulvivirga sediminis]
MLVDNTIIKVRFSEVDSMGILWHGHYIKYFEDGRESFGAKYDIGYMDVFNNHGYLTPIVKVDCNYKRPIRYNDKVAVETTFVNTPAAKLIFKYRIYNTENNETYATGRSEQVFLTEDHQLHLTVPDFLVEWKKNWNIEI